ncbi:MAG: hypothetical protein JXA78_04030 [Anaerolineales bacterium]|nr:hypothetical protein [Anaerolineales bacterium]
MNIVRNEKIVKRNARIAQFTMLAGLAVLVGGMYYSFRNPEQVGITLSALMLGFLFSQIGIFFMNRWGRRPRPDEHLDQALKGLDKKYTLYHYTSPVSHLLVGPAGVWVLKPQHQRGIIRYEKGRWQQRGGGLALQYLKIFAQEGLGRPDLEVLHEVELIQNYLGKIFPGEAIPPVKAALVFTHPNVQIEIPEDALPPAETVSLGKLKELIRKSVKAKALSQEKSQIINDALAGS